MSHGQGCVVKHRKYSEAWLVISGERAFWQRNSQCKSQEEAVCLMCSRHRQEGGQGGRREVEGEAWTKMSYRSKAQQGWAKWTNPRVNPFSRRGRGNPVPATQVVRESRQPKGLRHA
ncbi:hypothetical protein Cadr_000017128 [Camelus dromedarius]|uniref:Uncharacterized protein n=1 Tax=Camelus dromedarius TaxID=9838 RepID=A0A5N4DEU5_CAMDR|nr:hypothetical protein Cadr_000017128 [Camelus dromedarius]